MHIPDSFSAALVQEFDGRLRLRWSDAKHEFHVEQKVAPMAALPPLPNGRYDDRHIRAQDGYVLVMAIQPREYMPCPKCGTRYEVPALKTAETHCPCGKRIFWAYFPLSDVLIRHLKKLDPNRDGHKAAAREADLQTERAEYLRRREVRNIVEAATYDDKYQIFGTPFSGYTGKRLPGSSLNGRSL